jgi:hypothetical protein
MDDKMANFERNRIVAALRPRPLVIALLNVVDPQTGS